MAPASHLVAVIAVASLSLLPVVDGSVCGYESCNKGKEGMINVHIVPHTHDDVGWIKTVDGYYTSEVQYILDGVVESLLANPARRFTYVETAFFYRWWSQQSDAKRHRVKGLVNEGRLMFALGGWCMNDEASTHYNAIIDQHTRGVEFIRKNFGECGRPLVAWQIDPFGHSREQASLFAQMGYDAVYFARIDYQDHARRLRDRSLEMLWEGDDSLGAAANLFSGAFYGGNYGPPNSSLDWDIYSLNAGMPSIQDDHRLRDYNVDQVVDIAVGFAVAMSKAIVGDVLFLMGDDFNYQDSHTWYKNLDKLIKYTNARQAQGSKVNMFYSTPSCYTLAKNRLSQTWPTKSDDFFPYAHRAHAFWTGYFTSRAALKGFVRFTNNYLQVAKQVDVLAALGAEHSTELKMDALKRAMGVLQHHDAVSGTEKQFVADDYSARLSEGIAATESVVSEGLNKLLSINGSRLPSLSMCLRVNISECPATESSNRFYVTLYNPIGRPVNTSVRLPVTGTSYTVLGPDGLAIPSQIIPVSQRTMNIPERKSSAAYELVFVATLPPLGTRTFGVQESAHGAKSNVMPASKTTATTIANEYLTLKFDPSSGLLKGMYRTGQEVGMTVRQSLLYYNSMAGNNSAPEFTASGAYIFRPNGSEPLPLGDSSILKVITGPVVQEVWQRFGTWGSQVFRLYTGLDHVEVEWTVGPIPVDGMRGKEVISRYTTDLDTGDRFYTDANGRQLLERRRNFRQTWILNQTEPVAGNYFPVNSRILIKDDRSDTQLSILTDRSEGGSSLHSGEVELMVHRRNCYDDGLGVAEALNEKGVDGKGLIVRGKHFLILDKIKPSAMKQRDLGEKTFMQPMAFVTPSAMAMGDWSKQFKTEWSCMNATLPANVHLLTLEGWDGATSLLRLEHFYSKNEDPVLSQNVSLSLKNLFSCKTVSSATELTLSANQVKQTAKRLIWNGIRDPEAKPLGSDLEISLSPMQIRTFQVTFL